MVIVVAIMIMIAVVVAVLMPPFPVLTLFGFLALAQFAMLKAPFSFPAAICRVFVGVPPMRVVVVRVLNAVIAIVGASGHDGGCGERGEQQPGGDSNAHVCGFLQAQPL